MRHFLAVVAVAFAAGTVAADNKINLTGDNTTITFVGSKPDGKHEGGFKKLTGTATEAGGAWAISVEIDIDSIHSDNANLTAHLKNADFFSVKEYPTAKFNSTKIEKDGDHFKITGTLKLCGKEKEISFPAKIDTANGFKLDSEFKINRTDFGMTYGKGKIDDEVKLTVKVDAKK